jgi:hypothetical protein
MPLKFLSSTCWLLSFFAVAFIVAVQAMALRVNASVAPMIDPNSRFSISNWITV